MRTIENSSAVFFFPLFKPEHLDRLKLSLGGFHWIVIKSFQVHHPLMEIRKPHFQGIRIGMIFRQLDADVFSIIPSQLFQDFLSR